MLKRDWDEESKGIFRTVPIQSLAKLQPWFLGLRWKTCLRQNCSLGSCTCSEEPVLGQTTLMTMIIISVSLILNLMCKHYIDDHHCGWRSNRYLSYSGPRFDPRSGQFRSWAFFWGFPSTWNTSVRKFRPQSYRVSYDHHIIQTLFIRLRTAMISGLS